jgi:hypothetical protein
MARVNYARDQEACEVQMIVTFGWCILMSALSLYLLCRRESTPRMGGTLAAKHFG